MQQYDPQLAGRPELIAVSKAELPGADDVARRLAEATAREVIVFSSVTGAGLNQLMRRAYQSLSALRAEESPS